MGDIRAQLAAGWVGAEALARIARDYQLDDLHAVADEIIGRSEQAMRVGIASLPRGTFTQSMPIEIGGLDEPARINCLSRSKPIALPSTSRARARKSAVPSIRR